MRSDEEIHRLLEDWLASDARPMPREALEATLEAVSRVPQVSRPHASPLMERWRLPRFATVATVLILVAVAGGLAVDRIGSLLQAGASAGPQHTWDPAIDLGRVSNRLNPGPDSYGHADVWSYLSSGEAHSPSRYLPLPAFADGEWDDPAFVNLHGYLEGGGVLLHPYRDPQTVRYLILGWRSPLAAEVSIHGTFALVDTACTQLGSGIEFLVDVGSSRLFGSGIPSGGAEGFDLRATVGRGESVYFIVDPGKDSSCDSTRLTLTIATGDATPDP